MIAKLKTIKNSMDTKNSPLDNYTNGFLAGIGLLTIIVLVRSLIMYDQKTWVFWVMMLSIAVFTHVIFKSVKGILNQTNAENK